jgi:hypothetical protein
MLFWRTCPPSNEGDRGWSLTSPIRRGLGEVRNEQGGVTESMRILNYFIIIRFFTFN